MLVFAFVNNELDTGGYFISSGRGMSWRGRRIPSDLEQEIHDVKRKGEEVEEVSIGLDGDWFLRTDTRHACKTMHERADVLSKVELFVHHVQQAGLSLADYAIQFLTFVPDPTGYVAVLHKTDGSLTRCVWHNVPQELDMVLEREGPQGVRHVTVGVNGAYVVTLNSGAMWWGAVPERLHQLLEVADRSRRSVAAVSLSLVQPSWYFVQFTDGATTYTLPNRWHYDINLYCTQPHRMSTSYSHNAPSRSRARPQYTPLSPFQSNPRLSSAFTGMPQQPVYNDTHIYNNPVPGQHQLQPTSSLDEYNGMFTLLGGALKLAGAVLGPTLQDDWSLLYQSEATAPITMAHSRFEGIVSSLGRECDTIGVTLNDVKELSNPSAALNDEARKREEDEARRREQEKSDRDEREKQRLDTVVPPIRLPRNAGQLKIYRHLFSFLADKINSMKTLDPRLENLLPRLHTHFENFVDYDIIVSISESRQFRETLLEASSMVGLGDKRFTTALDNDGEEICALFQEVLLDSEHKSTVRSLHGEQARGFSQELQEALKGGSPLLQEELLQRTAQRILIDLSRACGDVPNELYIKETIENVSSKPIYAGGFGQIYRGRCNGKPVAVKRLFELENAKLVKAFCKEAMIWKGLCGHPHILAFLGVDIESFPGEMCMVSEWMSKGTIIEFLKRETHHGVEKYLLQIAEGVQHLHSQGMYHGDLKGANILVSSDREAKIADFGFANFADMSVSYTTARVGTPRWMAPELLDPRLKFQRTKKSDIFAFACIAFEIYTGAPIFPDEDNFHACQQILTGKRPERPTDGRPMPNRMWDLIGRCWLQDPSSRPQIEDVVKKMRELQELDGSVPRNYD